MKTTPTTAEGFTDTLPSKHEKQEKSPVAKENDELATAAEQDEPLHRKEDSTQGDEGVD
ncbi:MAG: hypothetical protein ACAI34_17115 [Verrucomicrobium sp.]|nr:hypothetical protein [Verrucomicrobium sp.]